ncbi:MAG TPA: RES family NAD+ phosphorylase [Gemmataceae bacterium]|nr:RES family NAD+ phosphorylase [Gemmataceae bacterium]
MLYETPPPATVFYRAADRRLRWSQILTGLGAFLGNKKTGRYHGSRQRTVYAASDPLVAITEAAFYEALGVQWRIGTAMLAQAHQLPPLRAASFRLWAFRLDPPPTVLDLEDPGAHPIFNHPPFVLRNPTTDDYRPTQNLMDAVFNLPANAAGQKAWGVKAPSARTPRVALVAPGQWFHPFHYAFIVQPHQQRLPATRLDSWDVELEFFDQDTQAPVTAQTVVVDWQRPRFRLVPRAGAGAIPAFAGRPGAVDYTPNVQHTIQIEYA